MKKEFWKKKKAAGFLALALAGIMTISGSLAYFTDRKEIEAKGTAGSLDISINGDGIKLLDSKGLNILNPGDLRKVSYTVTEEGNKAVDVRETVQLSAVAANGKALNFMTNEPKPVLELYDVPYPGDGQSLPADAQPIINGKDKLVVDMDKHSVTYHMDPYVLSGNPDKGDAENDGDSNVKQHDYTLSFDPVADNTWQGATIKMEILVEGKQHRNTQGKWTDLSKETYIFSNGAQQNVVPKKPVSVKVATLVDGPTFNARVLSLAGGKWYNVNEKPPYDQTPTVASIEWGTPPSSASSTVSSSSATASVDLLSSPASLFVDQVHAASDQDHIVSTPDSPYPIRADLVNGTLYLQTEANKIYTNADASSMFSGMFVSNIPFDKEHNVDTSLTTNMSSMFYECGSYDFKSGVSALATIDVSKWDTSNVTDMSNMFHSCRAKTLDVSGWDTSKVTDMSNMFQDYGYYDYNSGISTPATIDVSKWDTSNVTNMRNMFNACRAQTLDVSGWDTSKVTDMSSMFNDCMANALDVSGWDTGNVTNMGGMFCSFAGGGSVTNLDVSRWDTSKVTNMNAMFAYHHNITAFDLSGWDISKVTDMNNMFWDCPALKEIIVGPKSLFLPSAIKTDQMFDGCPSLPGYDYSKINGSMWKPTSESGYLTFPDKYSIEYTVHFDKNSDNAIGTMSDEDFAKGEKKALPANTYTRSDDYVFKNWNTKADGSGRVYTNQQVVQNLCVDANDPSITLYVQWRNKNKVILHTANINDDGVAKDTYLTGIDTTDTATIDDASKIKVEIWFSTGNDDYVQLCDADGNALTADVNGTKIGNSAEESGATPEGALAGGSNDTTSKPDDNSDYHKTFILSGNTVNIKFNSEYHGYGYGYYAIVTKVA